MVTIRHECMPHGFVYIFTSEKRKKLVWVNTIGFSLVFQFLLSRGEAAKEKEKESETKKSPGAGNQVKILPPHS